MPHTCLICNKIFQRKGNYDRHIKACEHLDRTNKAKTAKFKCVECGKQFIYQKSFKSHAISCKSYSKYNCEPSVFNLSDSFFDHETTNLDFDLKQNNLLNSKTWLDELEDFSINNHKNVKILHLNINSLFCKFFFISNILTKNIFDFIFIQETKLNNIICDNFFDKIVNYSFIRKDRDYNSGGGLIVFYKSCYKILNPTYDPLFETLCFSTHIHNRKLTFISSYNPHFKYSKKYLLHLEHILTSLNLKSNTLLIGDLNHDLLSNNGNNLLSLMSSYNFTNFNNKPTRISNDSTTLLDVLFANCDNIISNSDVFDCPFSDHRFLVAALNIDSISSGSVTIETRQLNDEKISLISNKLSIDHMLSLTRLVDNSDDKFYAFTKSILDVLNEIAPLKQIRLRNRNLPWVDYELRLYLSLRDKVYSIARLFDKSHEIWNKFRCIRNYCKTLFRRKMADYFQKKTIETKSDSRKFWSFQKSIIKTKKSSDVQPIPNILDADGNSHSDQLEIANIFNKSFTNIKIDLTKPVNECKDFIDHNFYELKRNNKLIVSNSFSFSHITSSAVESAINGLDSTSSSGITGIPISIIKGCSNKLAPVLAELFNFFIRSGQIPKILKQAIVNPLFKKGDPTLCDNYRGISILSPFAKIFETR